MDFLPTSFSSRRRYSWLLAPLLALGFSAHAQGPDEGGPDPGPNQPTAVPIDGGASLLLAAGAAYGVRLLKRRRS